MWRELSIPVDCPVTERKSLQKAFDQLASVERYPLEKKAFEQARKRATNDVLVRSLREAFTSMTDVTFRLPCSMESYVHAAAVLAARGDPESLLALRKRVAADISYATPFDAYLTRSVAGSDLEPYDCDAGRGNVLRLLAAYRRVFVELAPSECADLIGDVGRAWRTIAVPTRAYRLLLAMGVEPPSDTDWMLAILPRSPSASVCIEAEYTGFFSVVCHQKGSPCGEHIEVDDPTDLRRQVDTCAERLGVRWSWSDKWDVLADTGTIVKANGFDAQARRKINQWARG